MTQILPTSQGGLTAGQLLARGVGRMLHSQGFACVQEFVPTRGLRVDVMALGARGELWIVECKSCRADFMADHKWQNYLPWCDRFFWAVDADFPDEILPADAGLIRADGYGAEITRWPASEPAALAGARRKVLTRKLALHAARRLQGMCDPGVQGLG